MTPAFVPKLVPNDLSNMPPRMNIGPMMKDPGHPTKWYVNKLFLGDGLFERSICTCVRGNTMYPNWIIP